MNHIVIMAGGVGSRFWPVSTPEYPKQFIDILGCGKSLIQLTVERFAPFCAKENFWVVTNERYRDIIREQLPGIPETHILCEPVGRNTAPCIALACWKIKEEDPQANIAVTPSDAFVTDSEAFRGGVSDALDFAARHDNLLTIGITPTRPETGYGYIHMKSTAREGVTSVDSFREKPSAEVAMQYFKDGGYLWNAGIFVWNVAAIEKAIREYKPGIAAKMDEIVAGGSLDEIFPECEKISIDYAVMEPAAAAGLVCTRPVECGWTDLGNWTSLWEKREKDEQGNCVSGNVTLSEDSGCVISVEGLEKVVVQGLSGYIVAYRDGRLLICRREDEQRIRDFAK